jgi:hypothetical protein
MEFSSSKKDNIYSLEKIDIVYSNPKMDQKYVSILYLKRDGVLTVVKIEDDDLENLINKTNDFVRNKI